jgi:hypothetical protein
LFISATSDLASYRREAEDTLLSLQKFPIQERNFTLSYAPLTSRLRAFIERCDAVIYLAGFYYGTEPPTRPPDQPRRSYAQLEYDIARELGTPIYIFLATENCEFDACPWQSEEKQELQRGHRRGPKATFRHSLSCAHAA